MSSNARPAPVITFCDREYIPMLANFIVALRRATDRPVLVYALDRETSEFVATAGACAVLIGWDGSLADLWKMRNDVFKRFVGEGRDFIHSDVDAIWLDDPFDDGTFDDVDIAYSSGSIFPKNILKQTGFVLCCGLVKYAATPAVGNFLTLVGRHMEATGDDQRSVNEILFKYGTIWEKPAAPDYRLQIRGETFSCWKTVVRGNCARLDLDLALVPHGMIQRIHDPMVNPAGVRIKHLLTPANAAAKLDYLAENGLLFIKENWRAVPADAPFCDYVV